MSRETKCPFKLPVHAVKSTDGTWYITGAPRTSTWVCGDINNEERAEYITLCVNNFDATRAVIEEALRRGIFDAAIMRQMQAVLEA